MSLTATDSGGEFKSVENGTYVARCIKLIDLGTQHGEYQGKPVVKRQVLITWELPTELIEGGDYDGQPYAMSKFYTASTNEKSILRKDLESWRGRTFTDEEINCFDITAIVGKACMISVVKNDKGKTKVSGVMALPKGMICPEQINPTVVFDMDIFDKAVWDSLSDGIKKIIEQSDEYQVRHGHGVQIEEPPPYDADNIPF